jgi:hypothetical protein
MHQERKNQKFAVLLIDVQESPGPVAAWVKANGVTPPILLDKDGAVTAAYRVTVTPTAVLIGRDGRMVGRAIGTRPWDSGVGRQLLDALVAAPGR